MSVSISELEGMSPALAEKLQSLNIGNSDKLLEAAKDPAGRTRLAKQTEVATRDILELANRADLARIKGVAGAFSDLLERAGVDTVKELAARRPDNLHAKIVEVNTAESLTKRVPSASEVESWVAQAKEMPKILTY